MCAGKRAAGVAGQTATSFPIVKETSRWITRTSKQSFTTPVHDADGWSARGLPGGAHTGAIGLGHNAIHRTAEQISLPTQKRCEGHGQDSHEAQGSACAASYVSPIPETVTRLH